MRMNQIKINLRTWQTEALLAQAGKTRHIIRAVMGSGKSICMAELCRTTPDITILVTAPTLALCKQLRRTLAQVTGEDIGAWYTGEYKFRRITVACHKSLEKWRQDRTIDLWIADECHKTEAPGVIEWYDRMQPTRSVGFSATPYRPDSEPLTLWDDACYNYGFKEAVRDAVILKPTVLHPELTPGADPIPIDDALVTMIAVQNNAPGAVNAANINDAEEFAKRLELELNLETLIVHSKSENDAATATRIIEEAYKKNKKLVVVYVNMLAEGFDAPHLTWIGLRRDTGSPVRFAQEVGRVLRTTQGKRAAYVLDPLNLFGRHQLDRGMNFASAFDGESFEMVSGLKLDTTEFDNEYTPETKQVRYERILLTETGQHTEAMTNLWFELELNDLLTKNTIKFAGLAGKTKSPSEKQMAAIKGIQNRILTGQYTNYSKSTFSDSERAMFRAFLTSPETFTAQEAAKLMGMFYDVIFKRVKWR